ncbi:MAG: hypothetical protein HY674_12560 [Chloroflexi bacterium]|nr:hypothetical protein [Chloroflexota bacterium]
MDSEYTLLGFGRLRAVFRQLSPVISSLLLFATQGCCHLRSDFYLLGIYSAPIINDLQIVRNAGFILVTGSANKAYLDATQALGLKVLASPNASAGPDFDAEAARRAVLAFNSHPALWAWYLVDEPDLHNIPPETVQSAHRFLKRLPARKPTVLVIYQGSQALHYADITDIMMIDRYPVAWLPLANFSQHVRMTRLALGKKKPLIAVIQSFDWSYYPELLPNEKNFRPPNLAELRSMTYAVLAQRASGIFYYCFADWRWYILDHPQSWDALLRVVHEVNDRRFLFQAEHIWWPHEHEYRDSAGRFNAALEASISAVLLRVRNGDRSIHAGDYILMVNTTDRTHGCRFLLPGPLLVTLPVLGENRSVEIEKKPGGRPF